MHEIDVGATDLNLLVVLDVLLQERSVTRAAKRLHRTQSATSHALARLREQLGDPLLVRVGGRMQPTPRAERLGPEVSRILRTIGRVLGQEVAFDPRTTDRIFTVCAPDFVAAALPALVARMATETPSASVEVVPARLGMLRDVADGRYDLAISPARRDARDGLVSMPLARPRPRHRVVPRRPSAARTGRASEAWSCAMKPEPTRGNRQGEVVPAPQAMSRTIEHTRQQPLGAGSAAGSSSGQNPHSRCSPSSPGSD